MLSEEKQAEEQQEGMKWSRKLPEIDIIPVYQDDVPIKDGDLSSSGEPVKITQVDAKKLSAKGYANPFIYKANNKKTASKKMKNFEQTNTKWTCMLCNVVAKNKESLIEHYEVHKLEKDAKLNIAGKHETDYFNCSICFQEFTSLNAYEKHFDRKHGDKKFTCFICEKFYKDAYQLSLHNYAVHPTGDNRYSCIVCEFKTSSRKTMKIHIQDHEDSCQFKCDICGRGFEIEASFEEHKIMHGNVSSFSCDICGETFPYTRLLDTHRKTDHPEVFGDGVTGNECHLCGKNFADKKSLILHVRGHTGENSVLCDMCGKRLSSGEHLKQHLRVHTGYKPHTCSVCGKGFAKKCNLTLHERVHSGEKPYICPVCSKAFSQRSTLVIHQRYHSGERPYVCTLCNKGFVAKGLLSVHIKNCTVIPAEYL